MPHPLAHGRDSIYKCQQHTIYDPWGPDKYNYTMIKYGATFLTVCVEYAAEWVAYA